MQPKPSPRRLLRIGGRHDGAYLVPDDLEGIAACFSPGVANRKDFEDELVDRFGIPCHLCDYSSDEERFRTALKPGMQTFLKKWLEPISDEKSISLEDWVADLAPDPADDLLLQMDIEGAEYRNLLACPDEVLARFRIIVIEVHGLQSVQDSEAFERGPGSLLRKLDRYFICVHAHPNNHAKGIRLPGSGLIIPRVFELTFLRRDRFEGSLGTVFYPPMNPHPLDIASNWAGRPALFLDRAWFEGRRRSLVSTIAYGRVMLESLFYLCMFYWIKYIKK
jgi:hypothetical protein